MNWHFVLISAVVLSFIYFAVRANKARQLKYIEQYYFHKGIRHKLSLKYPQLTEQQLDMVFQGLREYFRICHRAKKRMVSMPSQVIDDAWHEFILSTRIYERFCHKALGRFLHHTPTEAMATPTLAREGIKRSWRLACALEHINPKKPSRLPLIFAMDGLLNIDHGFIYQLDCTQSPVAGYCASHIGCSSGCSGSSGGSDKESGFSGLSDLFDDLSGCGGDGGADCGGGCGGD